MTRVAVFIDYSNAYYTARDVFGIQRETAAYSVSSIRSASASS